MWLKLLYLLLLLHVEREASSCIIDFCLFVCLFFSSFVPFKCLTSQLNIIYMLPENTESRNSFSPSRAYVSKGARNGRTPCFAVYSKVLYIIRLLFFWSGQVTAKFRLLGSLSFRLGYGALLFIKKKYF